MGNMDLEQTGQSTRRFLRYEDLPREVIIELRYALNQANNYECFYGNMRFLTDELKMFLWYWDNRLDLRKQMALEYEFR